VGVLFSKTIEQKNNGIKFLLKKEFEKKYVEKNIFFKNFLR